MTLEHLDDLLGRWAASQQLTTAQVEAVRRVARGAVDGNQDAPDVDWLWSLMRPVTTLLDGPHRQQDTIWRPYTPSA
jgi:hypothetical protein